MKILRGVFDLKKVSVFLIALPYLCFNYKNIIYSPFYSFSELLTFLSGLLLIDLFLKWLLLKLNDKLYTTMSLFTVLISSLFFYGFYLSIFIQKEIQVFFLYFIRGRVIIEFLLVFFILLILLIISDEYTSPDDLYEYCKDSSVFEFSNELISKGWITKNYFYSYETSTIHSLSSLFNFNLSKNNQYQNEEIRNIGVSKLLHASIADSLEKKKIEIINFGIFHIGKTQYLNRLYLYSTSFIEDIMLHTIYYTIKNNTGNLNKSGLSSSYFPMESHNKYIFNHLTDSLNSLSYNKAFVYIHLFMPHSPMQYMPNFPIRIENNILNYKAYWDFTNQKLKPLLSELIRENKYRIILTGDHGYRSYKRINPHYTFSAFYGFNQESIDKINSVQDLGSLINGGF